MKNLILIFLMASTMTMAGCGEKDETDKTKENISYQERLRTRREEAKKANPLTEDKAKELRNANLALIGNNNSIKLPLEAPDDVKQEVGEYQMKCIKSYGVYGPVLPRFYFLKMDDRLVSEGYLYPRINGENIRPVFRMKRVNVLNLINEYEHITGQRGLLARHQGKLKVIVSNEMHTTKQDAKKWLVDVLVAEGVIQSGEIDTKGDDGGRSFRLQPWTNILQDPAPTKGK